MKFSLNIFNFIILMIINTLIYTILKLTGIVTWNWFIVTIPLWFMIIPLLLMVIISVITYFTTMDDY